MEGIYHPASARLAAAARAREAVISSVEGILRAEKFAADGSGWVKSAHTEDDLADKLDGG